MKPIRLPCYCGSLRQASRVVTQLYDQMLKPSGVKITQFSILKLLAACPDLTTGGMADALAMDSTTLTRTLKILQENRWIEAATGTDRRQRCWRITADGLQRLQHAEPLWEGAQKEFTRLADDVDLDSLTRSVFLLVQKVGG
ncbi:MarR family winged helix-turn-helix transcriptional regulator [Jeongeupia naejangsanensis]|uniref:Winged helix-turn-helix transcriptional regulator n=1 Tax=Jeongeupia naejangsanensis TaxID=613195 RepID=A0ABS2BIL2_9NEIS|nr:MarR family winged helix-turn-helix transcriptional regulator [Jeongeupia naejangsanensis]MBM3114801.1 winged helix-turn-helix transcriptional regulator [Jeongeupia naejangsanensis]